MMAVCVLRREVDHKVVGIARLKQRAADDDFTDEGVLVHIKAWDLPPGDHGFHIHKSGNVVEGAHTLCSHFNPVGDRVKGSVGDRVKGSVGDNHGNLNESGGHAGDLGNLTVDYRGQAEAKFVAKYISLRGDVRTSVIGRSMVIHADPDDLGLGNYPDSKTTGHSGDRIAYGIIGIDEPCP